MGLFDKILKGADSSAYTLVSPLDGETVPLSMVPDPAFSDGILGKGVAIIPSSNVLCSPCDGTIDLMFDTGHAVNIVSNSGMEVLVHLGLETVALKGKHFKKLKATGNKVKKGEPLIEFEREQIAKEGYNTIVPIVICNTDSFSAVNPIEGIPVKTGDQILSVKK